MMRLCIVIESTFDVAFRPLGFYAAKLVKTIDWVVYGCYTEV